MSALAEVAHVLDVSPFTAMHSLRWLGDNLMAGGDAAEAGGEAGGRGDGLVTSVVAIEEAGGEVAEVRALGYVRVKAGVRAGDIVMARGEGLPEEGVEARVCDLPFA